MHDMDFVNEVVDYFNTHDTTVRETAKVFFISKSTVYNYVANVKPNPISRMRLDKNKAERHIRGGQATKNKYLKIRS